MIKSLLKDTLIYSLPTILSRGIGIILLPLYTRIMSPEQLGALELFIAFGNILAITVAFEITQAISRYIPEASSILRGSYAFTGIIFTSCMYGLAVIVMLIFANDLSFLITNSKDYDFEFKLIIISIVLNGHFYYFQNLLRFEGKSTQYSVASAMYALSNLIFVFLLGIVYDLSLQGVIAALIVSSLFGSMLSLFFLRNSFTIKFKFNLLKKLLSFSIPLVPASLLLFVSTYIDRFMINNFLNLDDVGIYSIGVKISSSAGLILAGFQMAITPLIYKNYKKESSPKELSIIFKYFSSFALLFFLVFSLFSKELLLIFTTPLFLNAATIIPMLVLAFLFSHMYVFMPGIAIKKKTHIILFINLLAAILNVVLNTFLIPVFGIMGAATSTCLVSFCGFICYVFYSQKFYYVYHDWTKYLLALVLSVVLILSSNYLSLIYEGYFLYVLKVLILSIFIAFIFMIDFLRFSDFKKIKVIFTNSAR